MDNLTLVGICIALGIGLQRVHVFRAAPEVLNAWVIWVALPALMFYYLPEISWHPDLIGLVAVPWLTLGLTAGLVLMLARGLGWSRNTTGAMLMVATLGNTSFLGIPMLEALLGPESIPYALLYDQAGSFLAVVLYLPFVVALYAGDGRFSWRKVLHKMFTFPPMIAAIITILTWQLPRPEWLQHNLLRLANTLVPVAMVAVGLQMRLHLPQGLVRPLVLGMVIKMVVLPALALGLIILMGMQGLIARTTLLEAAMPTMITAGIVAASHNLQPRLAAAMVGWGVVVSFFTLPVWAWIAERVF